MKMKNNFREWYNSYYMILLPYYNSFVKLFEEETPPSMINFCYYCFENTQQIYNNCKKRNEAYIAPNYLI